MSPELSAAIVSVVVASVVGYFMAERAARREFERDVQRVRTDFMAERAARELLIDPRWRLRTFAQIKRRLGGFEDDELRKILVRAGALRYYRSAGQGEEELWGLRDRILEDEKDDA